MADMRSVDAENEIRMSMSQNMMTIEHDRLLFERARLLGEHQDQIDRAVLCASIAMAFSAIAIVLVVLIWMQVS